MKLVGTEWTVESLEAADAVFYTLPLEHQAMILTWMGVVEKHGPYALQVRPRRTGWNDHPLFGRWAGRRASEYSDAGGRIVYRIDDVAMVVYVEELLPTHNY
jgi:hypothetical protein